MNPELRLSFPRNHLSAPNCDHIQPLIFLGGRSFLSTTSGLAQKKTVGKIDLAPLAIYSFPFNGTFAGMGTTLASFPESLSVLLPLFSTNTLTYVRWDPNSGDVSPLRLHQESLLIPPPVVMNHTAINGSDELYQFYDRQLSATLDNMTV